MDSSDVESAYGLVLAKLTEYKLKRLAEGTIPVIFKELREKKALDYDILKTPNFTEPHAAVLVSKKGALVRVIPWTQKICLLLVPLKAKKEGATVYALVRKSQKEEFEKIEKQLSDAGISVEYIHRDSDTAQAVASDWLYRSCIRLLLSLGKFQVSAIEVKEVRKFINEVSTRMGYVPKDKLEYIQQYGALLVSKNIGGKGLFSKNQKICVLFVPREENPKNWSLHMFGFENSVDDVNEIQKRISTIPNFGAPTQHEIIAKLQEDIEKYEMSIDKPTGNQKKAIEKHKKKIKQLIDKLQKFEGNPRNLKNIRSLLNQLPSCGVTGQDLNEMCSRIPKLRKSIMAQVVLENIPQNIKIAGTPVDIEQA